MFGQLRRRFTFTVLVALLAVLAVTGATIMIALTYNVNASASKTLLYIAENGGRFPEYTEPLSDDGDSQDKEVSDEDRWRREYMSAFGFGLKITPETSFEIRYFSVRFTPDGDVAATDTSHIAEVSKEKADGIAKRIDIIGKEEGMYGKYRYLSHVTDDGMREIIFLNCAVQMRSLYFTFYLYVAVMVFVLALTTFLVWCISGKVVAPYIANFENQKRFITDASHEIKTPIAIIDANAEVLKYTVGDNEWVDSIQNQTKRLAKLVKKLVTLSKMEEKSESPSFTRFSVSDAVSDIAHTLKPIAERRGIDYEMDIDHGVFMKGDEASVRQLAEILIENAVKYCIPGEKLRVSLHSKSRAVIFETYNRCEHIDPEKASKLFDRFYRADDSRARETGGYGIGLSIAKAIVNAHKGKISAATGENGDDITFTVIL